jgi:outer membrane lipoprotein-sorting protein
MKILTIIPSLILTLLLLSPSIPALSAETQKSDWTVEEVLLHVREREQTLVTFIAKFKQIQENSLFAEAQLSEGTLFFDHNGKLLMKMSAPETYLVFIGDQKMILGVPGSTSYRQKKIPGKKPFFKQMMGIGQLKNQYDIRRTAAPCGESCELELRPLKKSRRNPFSSIRARINTRQWLPEMIHLEEPGGDVTTFHLQFISINQPLPEGIFDIPIPDTKSALSEGNHDIK